MDAPEPDTLTIDAHAMGQGWGIIMLTQMDEGELQQIVGREIADLGDATAIDELGNELAYSAAMKSGGEAVMGFGMGAGLWDAIKTEFRILVCTDDAKYGDIREAAGKLRGEHTSALVAMLAAALGAAIGVAASVIAPILSLLLLVVVRIGVEAYCATRAAPR